MMLYVATYVHAYKTLYVHVEMIFAITYVATIASYIHTYSDAISAIMVLTCKSCNMGISGIYVHAYSQDPNCGT